MGWVFDRPSLTAIEIAWRWLFGLPFLAVCWIEFQKIVTVLPPYSTGLTSLDPQNPWVAAVQLSSAWALYRPHVAAILHWLLPLGALAWVVVSGLGRGLLFKRLRPGLRFRPVELIFLQAAWLAALAICWWAWFRAMQWVAATHITTTAEPDLIGFAMWTIFLSLGFFTAWALFSWVLSIAPLLLLLEERSALSSLGHALKLGKQMSAKLIEINLVMGIVRLALIVLAMVFSAAPLPFGDQLGPDALHGIGALSALFYLVASDYFEVVRLKGFIEFWEMFCSPQSRTGQE